MLGTIINLEDMFKEFESEIGGFLSKDLKIIFVTSATLLFLEVLLMNICSVFVEHSFSIWIIATSTWV